MEKITIQENLAYDTNNRIIAKQNTKRKVIEEGKGTLHVSNTNIIENSEENIIYKTSGGLTERIKDFKLDDLHIIDRSSFLGSRLMRASVSEISDSTSEIKKLEEYSASYDNNKNIISDVLILYGLTQNIKTTIKRHISHEISESTNTTIEIYTIDGLYAIIRNNIFDNIHKNLISSNLEIINNKAYNKLNSVYSDYIALGVDYQSDIFKEIMGVIPDMHIIEHNVAYRPIIDIYDIYYYYNKENKPVSVIKQIRLKNSGIILSIIENITYDNSGDDLDIDMKTETSCYINNTLNNVLDADSTYISKLNKHMVRSRYTIQIENPTFVHDDMVIIYNNRVSDIMPFKILDKM